MDRAKALEEEERLLHEKLHKDAQSVIKEKRILLFKEMLQDIGYDDMSVVELLSVGVRIIGLCQNTGIWTDSDEKLPRTTVRHLLASARDAQEEVMNHKSKQEDELTKAVWDLTVGPEARSKQVFYKAPIQQSRSHRG